MPGVRDSRRGWGITVRRSTGFLVMELFSILIVTVATIIDTSDAIT